jgi:23S rRNA pseudouridine2605 synthase
LSKSSNPSQKQRKTTESPDRPWKKKKETSTQTDRSFSRDKNKSPITYSPKRKDRSPVYAKPVTVKKKVEPRREAVDTPNVRLDKLHKVLANQGLGSRREIETWIADARIKVNGKIAQLGDRVSGQEKIEIDGRLIRVRLSEEDETRVIVYHKPEGEVCTRKDEEGRKTVFENLPKLRGKRWVLVGRLDINTSGLLLLTTDGALANRLMHPSSAFEREYAVRILGEVTDEVRHRLLKGVMLEDGMASFQSITLVGGEGANRWYHVVVSEGRNRLVRRLWESQGLVVSRLMRVRYGSVTLPKGLARGKHKELTPEQIRDISQQVQKSV